MNTRLKCTLFIGAGLIGLTLSILITLWAMWASATPTWQTHSEPITQRYTAGIIGAAISLLSTIGGTVGLFRNTQT